MKEEGYRSCRDYPASMRFLVFIPTESGHLFREGVKKWPPSHRNGWPLCLGMGGWLRLEWVAGLARNMHVGRGTSQEEAGKHLRRVRPKAQLSGKCRADTGSTLWVGTGEIQARKGLRAHSVYILGGSHPARPMLREKKPPPCGGINEPSGTRTQDLRIRRCRVRRVWANPHCSTAGILRVAPLQFTPVDP
jgi:hypothetical protein